MVTEAEPRFLCVIQPTTRAAEPRKHWKMDSRTVGCSSSASAFNLGWEQLFEESTAEESSPKPIPGAIHDCVDAGKY